MVRVAKRRQCAVELHPVTKVHTCYTCYIKLSGVKMSCSWRRSWIRVYLEVQYWRLQYSGTYSNKHKGTNWHQHGHKTDSSFVL